uniref:RNase H type-1 domain-containing protein n=1 Tax=viral metagenome TaxID=1070528 RepID=A0A6C0D8J3_9ZZZZ
MTFHYINGSKKIAKCHLLRFDGNAKPNPGNISCGMVIYSPEKENKLLFEYGYFEKTCKNNNESECIALIKGLEYALQNNIFNLAIEGDSQFVIDTFISNEKPKAPYKEYYKQMKIYKEIFETLAIRHIPRKENSYPDYLARKAYDLKQSFETVFL